LHWSCIEGHIDTAIMLIKYGCSITEIDNNKKTPLFYINNDIDKQKLKDCYLSVSIYFIFLLFIIMYQYI
jgi:hypothetical protein